MTDYLVIPPVREVRGTIAAPPSKSATNRALVLAALSSTPVEIVRPLDAEDTRALERCLSAMGATIVPSEEGLRVSGPLGRSGQREVGLDAGESGTAARFLAALCAALPGRFLLTGSVRLRERPMEELFHALSSAGAPIVCTEKPGHLPVTIRGGMLQPAPIAVDASRSSQFFSALLLAGAAVEGGLEVEPAGRVASAPYVALTLESLRAFGHAVTEKPGGAIRVEPGSNRSARHVVPGDYSSALPLLAAPGIVGGEVTVKGLAWPSSQADSRALSVIERMGVSIERGPGTFSSRAARGALSPVTEAAGDFPDAVPSLAALAIFASGVSRFEGVAHLRWKESDRIDSVAALLERAGARARGEEGSLIVEGPSSSRSSGAVLLPVANDHRLAMAAALVSLARPGCLIENPGCVAKSYPGFFRDLESLAVR